MAARGAAGLTETMGTLRIAAKVCLRQLPIDNESLSY